MTFRMRGHEEASGTRYVPQQYFEEWGLRDPLDNFEQFLRKKRILSKKASEALRAQIKAEIEAGLEEAFAERPINPKLDKEQADVYAPALDIAIAPNSQHQDLRFVDAISDGLRTAMETTPGTGADGAGHCRLRGSLQDHRWFH
jgi:2-oxoisovalerate dehydrogenase E1 component